MLIPASDLVDLVMMGPSAHHSDRAEIERIAQARWPDKTEVTASFLITIFTPLSP
jgi:hypothetical protein